MERLLITTKDDMKRLMSMMYLDMGKYAFQKVDAGILIEFDEENPESLDSFADRFALWFTNESFVVNGDQYFEDHPHQEKWKIWKRDFRFLEAYSDDFYRGVITKRLKNFLYAMDDYFAIEVRLEDLLNSCYELTEMRMKLIDEHFTDGVHEDYILLRLQLKDSQKDALSF